MPHPVDDLPALVLLHFSEDFHLREGFSILLEKPDDIAFASELVAAIRTHLDKKGGRSC